MALVREAGRRRRLRTLALLLAALTLWLWLRLLAGNPVGFGLPSLGPDAALWLPGVVLCSVLVLAVCLPLVVAGRSPHVLYRSSEITVGMDDVRGARIVKEEVGRTLELFLAYRTFRETMGGTPRRAILGVMPRRRRMRRYLS